MTEYRFIAEWNIVTREWEIQVPSVHGTLVVRVPADLEPSDEPYGLNLVTMGHYE